MTYKFNLFWNYFLSCRFNIFLYSFFLIYISLIYIYITTFKKNYNIFNEFCIMFSENFYQD